MFDHRGLVKEVDLVSYVYPLLITPKNIPYHVLARAYFEGTVLLLGHLCPVQTNPWVKKRKMKSLELEILELRSQYHLLHVPRTGHRSVTTLFIELDNCSRAAMEERKCNYCNFLRDLINPLGLWQVKQFGNFRVPLHKTWGWAGRQ